MDFADIAKDIEKHWKALVDGYQPADTGLPLPVDYEQKTAAEKRTLLQERLAAPYDTLPTLSEGNPLRLVEKGYLQPLFTTASDQQPPAHPGIQGHLRDKLVHCFGVAGTMTFTPAADTPYSGLLAEPADVVVRLANAANPRDPGMAFNQSVAVKFLIDGRPSVNMLGLADPEGQGSDTNFFKRPVASYSGCPSSFGLKVALAAFERALDDPALNHGCPQSARQLPLTELGAVRGNGEDVSASSQKVPLGVQLVPVAGLSAWWTAQTQKHPDEDWRTTLCRVGTGTHLYDVVAHTPDGLAPGQVAEPSAPRIMGTLVTKTPLCASAFSDRRLMFQHPVRRDDVGEFPRC